MEKTSNAPVTGEVKNTVDLSNLKRVGQIRPQKGHTLFKYHVPTGKLTKVKLLEQDTENKTKSKAVIAEQGCIYVSSLNVKNAIKKIAQYHGIVVDLTKL